MPTKSLVESFCLAINTLFAGLPHRFVWNRCSSTLPGPREFFLATRCPFRNKPGGQSNPAPRCYNQQTPERYELALRYHLRRAWLEIVRALEFLSGVALSRVLRAYSRRANCRCQVAAKNWPASFQAACYASCLRPPKKVLSTCVHLTTWPIFGTQTTRSTTHDGM